MNRFIAALAFPALLALAAAPSARCQSVHWEPSGGSLPVGETTQIQLDFDGCSPKDTPTPPHVDGLTLQYAGQGSKIMMDNGTVTQSVEVTYSVLLSDKQSVEIPDFSVDTDKGSLTVRAVRFDPAAGATLGSTGVPIENITEAHLTTGAPAVWAGEVFPLKYTIEADRSFDPDYGRPGLPDWNPAPLLAEDWSTPVPFTIDHAGEPRSGLSTEARALARKPGRYNLATAHQLVNFNIITGGFGMFSMRQVQQVQVPAQGPTIEARPLPPAPAGFDGAVGAFHIASHIVPQQVSVNDPITWTIELSGTGNWPDISGLPSREVSSDFKVIQPKPRRVLAAGKLFDATLSEDVILMPTRPGTYTLPDVDVVAFNPKSGAYETLVAPGATVTVTAPAGAAASAGAAAGPGAPDSGAAPASAGTNSGAGLTLPSPPGPLPHDPIGLAETAPGPLTIRTLVIGAAALLAACAGLWAILATARARRTDSLAPRRLARKRLAATLDRLAAAPTAATRLLLCQWRTDAAVLAGIDPCSASGGQLGDLSWEQLWSEADRALFGPGSALPDDWTARARVALAGRTVPGLRWTSLLQGRNLFPTVLAVLAACMAIPTLRAGPMAPWTDLYRHGDFKGAESGLRDALTADPANWAARHDLALTLAQENRWEEAAAEAAAAFVQHPSDPRVRRTLALTCERAGYAPDPLAPLLDSRFFPGAAHLASPAEWQRVILGAVALAAVALALLLLRAYGLAGRGVATAAVVALAVIAVAGAAAGWLGWDAYGVAADSRAAIVWRTGLLRSIPTEADVTQQTESLDPGNVGLIDRRFLGWVHLSFPNGESGWVRSEEVIPLWR